MRRKLGMLAAACLAFALCFAFAGCGVDKSNYIGTWSLENGNDESLDADSIALMKSLGLEVRLVLDSDGTGSMDLFGDTKDVTWDATSATEGSLTVDDAKATLSLAETKLTVTDASGTYMEFEKVSDSTEVPSSGAAAASSSASASSSQAASSTDDQDEDGVGADGDEAADAGDETAEGVDDEVSYTDDSTDEPEVDETLYDGQGEEGEGEQV